MFSSKNKSYQLCFLFTILVAYLFRTYALESNSCFSCSTRFHYTIVRENPTLNSDVAFVYVKNEPLKVAKSFCK